MMEVQSSSEASVLTRAARHNIPEDAILPRELALFGHNSQFTSILAMAVTAAHNNDGRSGVRRDYRRF
jgi:hypothetical protein